MVNFVEQVTSKDHLIKWFVQNKAVSRQYHTWFDWEKKNANKFFGLFGDSFKNHISEKVRTNNDLELSIQAFLEIGHERNRLVHSDFGSFSLEKTSEEIYTLYSKAKRFVEWLPDQLNNYQ